MAQHRLSAHHGRATAPCQDETQAGTTVPWSPRVPCWSGNLGVRGLRVEKDPLGTLAPQGSSNNRHRSPGLGDGRAPHFCSSVAVICLGAGRTVC